MAIIINQVNVWIKKNLLQERKNSQFDKQLIMQKLF